MRKMFVVTVAVAVAGFAAVLPTPSIRPGEALAQDKSDSGFESTHINYEEWTKGLIAEVVKVRNPGTLLYLGGIAGEDEGGRTISAKGDFAKQCETVFRKIKSILAKNGATMSDIVKQDVFITDMRYYMDWTKCRAAAYAGGPVPAGAIVGVTGLAVTDALVEVEVMAVLPPK